MIARTAPETIAEIIAANQERCMRSEGIVEAIRHNPNILRSSLDRLFDFLVRAGIVYAEMHEFDDAMARLSPTEMEDVVKDVELPPELTNLLHDSEESSERAKDIAKEMDRLNKEDNVHERIPILKLIQGLSTAQKIALALKGNKEARTILIRDRNKLVCSAAIRSPRVTEPEIISAAKSRSASDDVIRIICRTKDMIRSYAVKLALVQNPKTPQQLSMRFLTLLRSHDLRTLARSKNIPSAVSAQARRMVARKG